MSDKKLRVDYGIPVPLEDWQTFLALCDSQDKPPTTVIRDLITQYIENHK